MLPLSTMMRRHFGELAAFGASRENAVTPHGPLMPVRSTGGGVRRPDANAANDDAVTLPTRKTLIAQRSELGTRPSNSVGWAAGATARFATNTDSNRFASYSSRTPADTTSMLA